jgi:hypothetical protein
LVPKNGIWNAGLRIAKPRPTLEATRRPFRFQLVRRARGIERRMTRPSGCQSREISPPRPPTVERMRSSPNPLLLVGWTVSGPPRSIRVWVQKYEAGDFDEDLEWAPGAHSTFGVIVVRFCPCRRATPPSPFGCSSPVEGAENCRSSSLNQCRTPPGPTGHFRHPHLVRPARMGE